MEKKKILPIIIAFSSIVLLFEIILFVIVGFKGHHYGFWINNVLLLLSFGLILFALLWLSKGVRFTNDFILGWPVVRHVTIFFVYTMVVGILAAIPYGAASVWLWIIFTVLQVVGLIVFTILTLSAFLHKGVIDKVEGTIQNRRQYLQDLKIRAGIVDSNAAGKSYAGTVNKLLNKVKYSEPLSTDSTKAVEDEIDSNFDTLEAAMTENDVSTVESTCHQLMNLLDKRNALSKNDARKANTQMM